MSDRPGIEQAVFGPVGRDEVDSWLTRHLRACLGAEVAEVLFRSGRVAAVFGCRLDDGQEVAVKVHRAGVDASHLAAAVSAQRHLARAGYPCPEVLHGPCVTQGRTAVVETLLPGGAVGDGHRPPIRAALAASLAEQVQLLRTTPAGPLRTGAPPWARYEHGPWPTPHDPIFDFSATPAGYAWLDRLAARAAEVLSAHSGADVVAHSDWSCGNVRFSGDEVCASFDWDSLAGRPEPVLAGMAAGSHTEGSAAADAAATPAEVAAFLVDYEDARGRPFGGPERAVAAAAACWVLAYNARCGLAFTPDWARPAGGSPAGGTGRAPRGLPRPRPVTPMPPTLLQVCASPDSAATWCGSRTGVRLPVHNGTMTGGMWAGRGPALRDRTVVDAAGQPVRRRTRHCWVTGPPEDPGEREGLVVAWLHSEPGGWRALVVYVLAPDGAGVEASTVVHAWVPAAQLRAAPP